MKQNTQNVTYIKITIHKQLKKYIINKIKQKHTTIYKMIKKVTK
jgi:hypothetical protein